MASTLELLRRLSQAKVEFVLVGGMAAIAHGSAFVTEDVDVCIRFDAETLDAVLKALAPVQPRERMNAARAPLGVDASRFVGNKNLYVVTTEGVIDFLGHIIAIGDFDAVRAESDELQLAGFSCRVLTLSALIRCKRALARPKDLRVAVELEAVQRRLKP